MHVIVILMALSYVSTTKEFSGVTFKGYNFHIIQCYKHVINLGSHITTIFTKPFTLNLH